MLQPDMLPPQRRLKKTDFVLLKKNSSKKLFSSFFFTLKQYSSGGGPSRFAVVASSAVFKKAVERNKAKRRIRGVVLEQADNFKDGFNAVIYLKKESRPAVYKDLRLDLISLFKKANILK